MMNGKIAPPTIDITSSEPPIFVSSPSSTNPNEKIVGNIIDIKNPSPPNAYTTYSPFQIIALRDNSEQINAYTKSKRCCLKNRKRKVPTNLPLIYSKPHAPR